MVSVIESILIESIYLGYAFAPTFWGTIVGVIWGFMDGFISGVILALLFIMLAVNACSGRCRKWIVSTVETGEVHRS
ncbi:hypothetical protein [Coxiella-like endosymbiont of Rhipicephalus sanguineus]|uniref:hypothetical protein n=1 Tax=Coxiella-like endosymbiont of Rhipicephalus sanguineus TaxID=1955402 RepID=UPI00203B5B4D|nr:hypothetical protein [Coxiella-like endosymbiont of Rhipicephalus sanguineus]